MKELDPMNVSDKTASLLKISNEQKQELLETLNPVIRLKKVLDILRDEMKIKKLENKLKREASDKFSDTKKAEDKPAEAPKEEAKAEDKPAEAPKQEDNSK